MSGLYSVLPDYEYIILQIELVVHFYFQKKCYPVRIFSNLPIFVRFLLLITNENVRFSKSVYFSTTYDTFYFQKVYIFQQLTILALFISQPVLPDY